MQASATLIHNLKGHNDEVARLLFSPHGKTLAVSDERVITLWDVETGSLRSKTEEVDDMYFELAFSPDSRWIAAASDEGHGRIWNALTGELAQTLSVEDERMLSLAFSPNSDLIATGSEIMRVWDVATGQLLHTLPAPNDYTLSFTAVYEGHEYPAQIWTVSFSPDTKWLMSCNPDSRTVCIWNTQSWKLERTIREYTALFSPDGRQLAVPTNEHKSIQIYETHTWQPQITIETVDAFSNRFSPDSKTLATHSGRQIKLWSVESGEAIKTFEDSVRNVSALTISPDGNIMISGTRKCGLRVWGVESGECLLMLEPEGGSRDPWNPNGTRCDPPAVGFSFSDSEAKVAIAFPDGSIKIWDVAWDLT